MILDGRDPLRHPTLGGVARPANDPKIDPKRAELGEIGRRRDSTSLIAEIDTECVVLGELGLGVALADVVRFRRP